MKNPNIILINCDDLGYGDLGCYGSEINKTPSIDYLADNGLRLTDFYMPSPLCSPSRGGMLTGCYPPRISFGEFDGHVVLFPGQGIGLSDKEETIASMLKRAGYTTKIIGKWHCGDQPEFLPTRFGFDSYYGLPYSNDMGVQLGNKGNAFALKETFPPLPLMDNEQVIQEQPDMATLTERYTEQAVRFIRENDNNPFFLYFAHMHVHRPIYVQDRFLQQSDNGLYGAAVETIDWSVQVLLHELESLGLRDDTLIIFTSDNGSHEMDGGRNAPLRGKKATTFEGGQRVPCIMYWPRNIKPGRVSDEIVSAIDFLPTFASIVGEKLQGNKIDGLDLSAFISGEVENSPRTTFVYYLRNELQAVRCGDYKLHITREGKELYNLRDDISEKVNVYGDYPNIVQRLNKIANSYRAQIGDSNFNIKGEEVRPCGRVVNPKMLTEYNENHPYIIAMYDKEDCG